MSIGGTIQRLQRNVETALRLSKKDTYAQTEDAPMIGGMVQGKADVPQFSTQQSEVLLQAQNSLLRVSLYRIQLALGTFVTSHHSI